MSFCTAGCIDKFTKNQAAFLRILKHLGMPLIGTKPLGFIL